MPEHTGVGECLEAAEAVGRRPGMSARMKTFHLEWGGEAHLEVHEIWPDGDAPENPTRDDVIAVMHRSRSLSRLCSDWELRIEGVDVDGRDSGLR